MDMSHDRVNREADALFVEAQKAWTGPEMKAVDAKFQEERARLGPKDFALLARRIEQDELAAHKKHPNDHLPYISVEKDQKCQPTHLNTFIDPDGKRRK